jgi:hypothetical protein
MKFIGRGFDAAISKKPNKNVGNHLIGVSSLISLYFLKENNMTTENLEKVNNRLQKIISIIKKLEDFTEPIVYFFTGFGMIISLLIVLCETRIELRIVFALLLVVSYISNRIFFKSIIKREIENSIKSEYLK